MGNVNGSSACKEIFDQLELEKHDSNNRKVGNQSSKSRRTTSSNRRGVSSSSDLNDLINDEEMIDQVYKILLEARKEGGNSVGVRSLRKYVKQHLKSSKEGRAVLDEMLDDDEEEEKYDDDYDRGIPPIKTIVFVKN